MKSKKGKGRSPKGSPFEREFCVRLSEWLTGGVTDEAFWRSQTSGARHTIRAKAGRNTTGQAGDIAATLPEYAYVTRNVVWELKRGYKELNLQRVLEAPGVANLLEVFITKLVQTTQSAGAAHWVFVSRRDQACAVIWMPARFVDLIQAADPIALEPRHGAVMRCHLPLKGTGGNVIEIVGVTELDFFETNPIAFLSACRD